ncbi:MAG: hypothetical protein K2X93_03775 [Candidatus Obscuribacterales bacterium]|nr:hypothetical protein [Candidatus Obscuribacterales bacterium]
MEQFELTQVKIEGLPKTFILESDSIDQVLLLPGRKLLGVARQQMAYETTLTWLTAMKEEGLLPSDPKDACTVTVLAEGIGHNLPSALGSVVSPHYHRGDNWIGVSRFALPKIEEMDVIDFDARVNYVRMHSSAKYWCMLDTVATGATLARALEAAFANAPKPERILMATPCGSAMGSRRIASVCEKAGVEIIFTFFGAVFGLWHDGTGLPWCHPDTVVSGTPRSRKNRQIAAELFNNLDGFCAVGDCSANFFDVDEAIAILSKEEKEFDWRLPIEAPVLSLVE